ncbi:hypothetical protein LTR24_000658 [Lithohypha guttulata]|uniref:Uncharacterized protein n=1 Tax=Lithohypha guttulata TaxID=1690604 RepID=A0ABR0KNG8_9EURO|nr:hypothetical protein LTR24_000658 [Lithohypha guttulata]
MADNNPGNFANRPKEEVQDAASKGGQSSAGGFASMDPDKQSGRHKHSFGTASGHVEFPEADYLLTRPPLLSRRTDSDYWFYEQKDIASQGGQASSGSFEPGSEKAKEAGRKGGQSS